MIATNPINTHTFPLEQVIFCIRVKFNDILNTLKKFWINKKVDETL